MAEKLEAFKTHIAEEEKIQQEAEAKRNASIAAHQIEVKKDLEQAEQAHRL